MQPLSLLFRAQKNVFKQLCWGGSYQVAFSFLLLVTGTHRTISPESPCTHVIDIFSAHACDTYMNIVYMYMSVRCVKS